MSGKPTPQEQVGSLLILFGGAGVLVAGAVLGGLWGFLLAFSALMFAMGWMAFE